MHVHVHLDGNYIHVCTCTLYIHMCMKLHAFIAFLQPKEDHSQLTCFYYDNKRTPGLVIRPVKVEVVFPKPRLYVLRWGSGVHTHTDVCTYTHIHTHVCMRTCTHVHMRTRMHTCTRIHIHTHIHTRAHTYTQAHTCTHTCNDVEGGDKLSAKWRESVISYDLKNVYIYMYNNVHVHVCP